MREITLILALFCFFTGKANAQGVESGSVGQLFLQQLSYYPQEKIYLQTDKSTYMPNDIIWFRVHLVDALFLKQANASRYAYVELIDSVDKLIQRVKIRPDSIGCFHGQIQLDENLTAGNYSLRTYTWFMQNQGEEYFHNKPIRIVTPQSEISGIENIPNPTFHVSFFPEGGNTPQSANIQMAFKAINTNGLSEDITGEIYDDQGQLFNTFQSLHLGMGSFRMYYTPGRKYYAVCTNKDGISKRFELPEPSTEAISLKMIWSKEHLRVALTQSPETQLPSRIQLIAHIRGAVIYEQAWNEKQGYIVFERDFFPAGIVHFLLIDEKRNILSERLVFSSQSSTFAHTTVAFDKEDFDPREKISLKIKVTNEEQEPLASNFALSVVDKKVVSIDTTSTIISTLLLTSELKGYIEAPMSYLQKDNRQAAQALDVLMMTQGWRRYDIPALLRGEMKRDLSYPVETGETISGKASGVFSGLSEGGISLLAVKDSVIGTAFVEPMEKGKFVFENLEYPEGSHYIIQALTKKGSRKVFLTMNPPAVFPGVSIPQPITDIQDLSQEETYLFDIYQQYKIEDGMRMYNLDEVLVTAKKKPEPKTQSPYYSGSASQVVSSEEIERWKLLSISDLLIRIPGVSMRGGEVYYRNERPMFIIDNIPNDDFDHTLLDINDINDAFALPATSVYTIFGSRASGGAIVINTKKGFVEQNKINSNIQTITAAGYQQPVEFYSPVYETKWQKEMEIHDLRTTIYWKPNVVTDETGTATVTFYSADLPSQYAVVIEGVSSMGHLIYTLK